jgi:hypothetical protein
MIRAMHVARMGVLVENPEWNRLFWGFNADRIILRWMLRK